FINLTKEGENFLQDNKKNAKIVCSGEKSILKNTLKQLESMAVVVEKRKAQETGSNNKKAKTV
ncbi:hypothetical protein CU098_003201, partial [Rhizopus stolonifer]